MTVTECLVGQLQEALANKLDKEDSEVAAARRCIQEYLDGDDREDEPETEAHEAQRDIRYDEKRSLLFSCVWREIG